MAGEHRPGRYRHFKGGEYQLLYTARHSETEEELVVYRALYGDRGIWVRPAAMWDEELVRDGKTVRRFTYIDGEVQENGLRIRFAAPEDTGVILDFVRQLAAYEKLSDQVSATEALLREWIFDRGKAEVLLAEAEGEAVGFALFFSSFSTFLGRAGIYLEDLFVRPDCRGRGCGKALLRRLAQLAVERGCGRLEWSCLDWNRPSIDFYLSLGAQPMEGWTTYRMAGETLRAFAEGE